MADKSNKPAVEGEAKVKVPLPTAEQVDGLAGSLATIITLLKQAGPTLLAIACLVGVIYMNWTERQQFNTRLMDAMSKSLEADVRTAGAMERMASVMESEKLTRDQSMTTQKEMVMVWRDLSNTIKSGQEINRELIRHLKDRCVEPKE